MHPKRLIPLLLVGCVLFFFASCLAESQPESYPTWYDTNTYQKVEPINDIWHYVKPDGETSVAVPSLSNEPEDSNIIWLRETSGGKTAWYGLGNQNASGQPHFSSGSRFHVKWLDEKQDEQEWSAAYHRLDSSRKQNADHLWMFDIGVSNPEQSHINQGDSTQVYIQLGKGWDATDIHACYIADGTDEAIPVSIVPEVDLGGADGPFAVLELSHFSPYAIFDTAKPTASGVPQTSDDSHPYLWLAIAAVSLAAVVTVRGRKAA